MKLSDLLARAGLPPHASGDAIEISAITSDSRQVTRGTLFAALPGTKTDGRSFIAAAQAAGASAILSLPDTSTSLPLVASAHPRLALAKLAASFYAPLPHTLAAVTGTNGKTSTANFLMQLWAALGMRSAAIGTLGITGEGVSREGSHTTPDPVTLAQDLASLRQQGVEHVALEASSHGLDQYRLDGLTLKSAGFTYLGRDHLDYHGTPQAYYEAKALLFSRLLPSGQTAVLNADCPEYEALNSLCHARQHKIISYGRAAKADLRLTSLTPRPTGLALGLELFGQVHELDLNVTGTFQAGNILCALGMAIGCGTAPEAALSGLSRMRSVRGRMELVGQTADGAAVYVDYAHTPDALETVLQALRPHTTGRLFCVFGCGGNRDKGKRPLMGEIATRLAECAYVTDDNPRHEDAATIRREILNAAPGAYEVGDRAKAIQMAIKALKPGDTLVIAGKGHEADQIVGDKVLPFDDADVARAALTQQDI